jgi:multicomponent Na+:H+ antiporter subunit E
MSLLLLNVLLAIAWAALTGSFQPVDLLFGFALGYLVLWISTRMGKQNKYFKHIPLLLGLIGVFLWDLLRANIRMAGIILSPHMRLRPAVVAVPLILKSETAIILLANLMTLTPGTLSLDISTDRQMLFIHTVYLEDPEQFRQELLEGYERRLKELFEE